MPKTLPNKTRGEFRAIYQAMVDHPRFQALTPPARLLLYTLKLSLGSTGIGTLYGEQVTERSGLLPDEWEAAAAELAADGWIQREGRVWWLVTGLEHEPTMTIGNANHRRHIVNHLASLPRHDIVRRFAVQYDLPEPFSHDDTLHPAPRPRGWSRRTPPPPQEGDGGWDPEGDVVGDPEGDPQGYGGSTPLPSPTPPETGIRKPAEIDRAGPAEDVQPTPTPSGAGSGGIHFGDLLRLANERLGLDRLTPEDRRANSGLLRSLLERHRDPGDVRAAILGLADLRDRGELAAWPDRPIPPGTPATLRLLVAKARTVRGREGSDGAVVSLWGRAVEAHYRATDPPYPGSARDRLTTAPVPLSAILQEALP